MYRFLMRMAMFYGRLSLRWRERFGDPFKPVKWPWPEELVRTGDGKTYRNVRQFDWTEKANREMWKADRMVHMVAWSVWVDDIGRPDGSGSLWFPTREEADEWFEGLMNGSPPGLDWNNVEDTSDE